MSMGFMGVGGMTGVRRASSASMPESRRHRSFIGMRTVTLSPFATTIALKSTRLATPALRSNDMVPVPVILKLGLFPSPSCVTSS